MKKKCQNKNNINIYKLKNPTSNTAITLIALIITIIILLILVAVTLNMVMGENGIIGKANNAKSKTEVAQLREELQICVTEIQVDEAEHGRTITLEKIEELLPSKVKALYSITDNEISINVTEEEGSNTTSKAEVTGVYKGYGFSIDNKFIVTIKEPVSTTEESYITMKIKSPEGVKEYTNQNVNLLVTIHNSVGIKQITKEDGSIIDGKGEKEVTIEYNNVEINTIYTYEIENTNGKKETKAYKLRCIDKLLPKNFEITGELTEEGKLTIMAKTEDAEETEEYASSGIEKYEYHVIDENNKEEIYTSNTISNLSGTKYTVYAIAYDRAGNTKQSEDIVVKKAGVKFISVVTGPNLRLNVGVGKNGKIYTLGNDYKPKALNSEEIDVEKISVGSAHTLILDKKGKIWVFGDNSDGQLGIGENQKQIDIPVQLNTRIYNF